MDVDLDFALGGPTTLPVSDTSNVGGPQGDPLLVKFLGLRDECSESELEDALVWHLQHFRFEARQPLDVRRATMTLRLRVGNAGAALCEQVYGLIAHWGFGAGPVAVEVNRGIVPRDEHASRRIASYDAIEIVHFVGGG